jgi:group I intron endonuclease
MPCIYIFTSPKGKSYIGQTKYNFSERKASHVYNATTDNNYPFYRAIRMYGIENFQEEVIECEEKELDLLERLFIAFFRSFSKVYNCTDGGGGIRGWHHSEEMRKKWSVSRLAENLSKETRKKMRDIKIGKVQSEETKEKIRQANLGRRIPQESIERMRQSKLGKHLSEEHKQKISLSNTGRKHSEETKKKIGQSNLGHQNMLGKKHSEATLEKMRASWARRKSAAIEAKGVSTGTVYEEQILSPQI